MRFMLKLAALASASAASLVLAAGTANASPTVIRNTTTVTSHDVAGYMTTRWTRQISVTFRLPTNIQCINQFYKRSPQGDGLAITLGNAEESNAGSPYSAGAASTVGFSFVPSAAGCGLISPSFDSNTSTYSALTDQFPADPGVFNPGDSVTEQLGYSKGAQVTWATVTDNTLGKSQHSTFPGAYTYIGGSVTAGFGPFTPTDTTAKLWAIKNAEMATYTGHMGALGAFRPQAINMTSDGTSAGALYAYPKKLWGATSTSAAQNFSIIGC